MATVPATSVSNGPVAQSNPNVEPVLKGNYSVIKERNSRLGIETEFYHTQHGSEQQESIILKNFSIGDVMDVLRNTGASLVVDLSGCYDNNDLNLLGAGPGGVAFGLSQLSNLALQVSEADPVKPGQMLIVGATCGYRTPDCKYVRVGDECSYWLGTDDSYFEVGLVPGEESDVVVKVGMTGESQQMSESLARLSGNCRYYMLQITEPPSYMEADFSWHFILVMYSGALTFRTWAERVENSELKMWSSSGDLIISVTCRDCKICEVEVKGGRPWLTCLAEVLRPQQPSHPIAIALRTAEGADMQWFNEVKMALVVLQSLEEGDATGEYRRECVMHSRIINDMISEADPGVFSNVVSLLNRSKHDLNDPAFPRYGIVQPEKPIPPEFRVEGFKLFIQDYELDLYSEAGHREEVVIEHRKRGALNVPQLTTTYRMNGMKVGKGLGVVLATSSLRKSYMCRGRRHVLRVIQGKLISTLVINLAEDPFFLSKLRSFQIGLDSAAIEMQDAQPGEVVPGIVVNGLLSGLHGASVARWVWIMLDSGALNVTQSSRERCYLGPRIRVSPDGYEIWAALSWKAVAGCVTYISIDTKRVWIDKYDRGQELLEVIQSQGGLSRLEAGREVPERGNLRECRILKAPDFS